MNVRIINKTGLISDTEIWAGDTRVEGITDIKLHFSGMGRIVQATVEMYVCEIDTIAEAEVNHANH